ncbi:hypothetical protein [Agrobacterium radiobacter]|uniref:hypothetical protein n=1 Tax=Agrobacterium radiobacter TaxID=362 RepID=UPI003F8248CF
MKIRMLLGLAGANFSLAPGDVPLDGQFSEKEALRLVDAGLAELVKDEEGSEVALRLSLDNENLLKELEELKALAVRLEESEARIVVLIGENGALQHRADAAEKSLAGAIENGEALSIDIAKLNEMLSDGAAQLKETEERLAALDSEKKALQLRAEEAEKLLEKALSAGATDQAKKSKSGAG